MPEGGEGCDLLRSPSIEVAKEQEPCDLTEALQQCQSICTHAIAHTDYASAIKVSTSPSSPHAHSPQHLCAHVPFFVVLHTHLGTHPASGSSLRHALLERVSEFISYGRESDILDTLSNPLNPPLKELASLIAITDPHQNVKPPVSGLYCLLRLPSTSSGAVQTLQKCHHDVISRLCSSSDGLWALSGALAAEAEGQRPCKRTLPSICDGVHPGSAEKVACILTSLAHLDDSILDALPPALGELARECMREALAIVNPLQPLGEDGLLFAEMISHIKCEVWEWPVTLSLMALEAALMARGVEQDQDDARLKELIDRLAIDLRKAQVRPSSILLPTPPPQKMSYKVVLAHRDHSAHALLTVALDAYDVGFNYVMDMVPSTTTAVELLARWASALTDGHATVSDVIKVRLPVIFAVCPGPVAEILRDNPKATAALLEDTALTLKLHKIALKDDSLALPFAHMAITHVKELVCGLFAACATNEEDLRLRSVRALCAVAVNLLLRLSRTFPRLMMGDLLSTEMALLFGRNSGSFNQAIAVLLLMLLVTEKELVVLRRLLSTSCASYADRRSIIAALRAAVQNSKPGTSPPFLQRYVRPHLLLACGPLREDFAWLFDSYWRRSDARDGSAGPESALELSLVSGQRLAALNELYGKAEKIVPGPVNDTLALLDDHKVVQACLMTQESHVYEPASIVCQTVLLLHLKDFEAAANLASSHQQHSLLKFVAASVPPDTYLKARRKLWKEVLYQTTGHLGTVDESTVVDGLSQILAESMCRPEEAACFLLGSHDLPVIRRHHTLKEGNLLEALAAKPQTCIGVLTLSDCIAGLEGAVPLMNQKLLSRLQTAIWTSAEDSRKVCRSQMPSVDSAEKATSRK